jgi:hypothetical protein
MMSTITKTNKQQKRLLHASPICESHNSISKYKQTEYKLDLTTHSFFYLHAVYLINKPFSRRQNSPPCMIRKELAKKPDA